MTEINKVKYILFRAFDSLNNSGLVAEEALAFVAFFAKLLHQTPQSEFNYEKIMELDNNNFADLLMRFQKENKRDSNDNVITNNINALISSKYNLLEFYYLKNLNKPIIKEALKSIIDQVLTLPEIRPTDAISIKIIQAFAKQFMGNGTFVDPCIGTGRLLSGLPNQYIGCDINPRLIEIAKSYLYFSDEEDLYFNNRIEVRNSLFDWDYNFNNVIVFDPPMGGSPIEIPYSWEYKKRDFFGSVNKASSELLFLVNILLSGNKKSDYVCLMPKNLLFSSTNQYKYLREYLVKNSLRAIIEVPKQDKYIDRVILAGHVDRNAENKDVNYIFLIKPIKPDFSEEELNNLAKACINSNNATIESFDHFKDFIVEKKFIEDFNKKDYKIELPYFSEIQKVFYDPPIEIIKKIKTEKEEILSKTVVSIEEKILNLSKGIKNVQETITIKESPEPFILWFNEIDINEINIDYKDEIEALTFILEDQSINKDTPDRIMLLDSIPEEKIQDYLENLRILFIHDRLNYNETEKVLEVFWKENPPQLNNTDIDFYEFIKPEKYSYIVKMICETILSTDQKDIYDDLVKFWFISDQKTILFKNFSSSKINLAFDVFNEFKLIRKLPVATGTEITEADTEIQEKFFPCHPLFNLEEETY